MQKSISTLTLAVANLNRVCRVLATVIDMQGKEIECLKETVSALGARGSTKMTNDPSGAGDGTTISPDHGTSPARDETSNQYQRK